MRSVKRYLGQKREGIGLWNEVYLQIPRGSMSYRQELTTPQPPARRQ